MFIGGFCLKLANQEPRNSTDKSPRPGGCGGGRIILYRGLSCGKNATPLRSSSCSKISPVLAAANRQSKNTWQLFNHEENPFTSRCNSSSCNLVEPALRNIENNDKNDPMKIQSLERPCPYRTICSAAEGAKHVEPRNIDMPTWYVPR